MSLALVAAGALTIGTNVHLPPTDTLDLEVDLGARWVRIDFAWDVAEPADGDFHWEIFDAIVGAAKQRGLFVYASLGGTPAWASTGDRRGDGVLDDVPRADKWRDFVVAAVTRYAGQIDVFGCWNEPNVGGFWEGTRQEFIDVVYVPFVEAVRDTCATCQSAGPEVATVGAHYAEWIQDTLAAAVPTILSAHNYAAFPEDDAAAGLTKDSFYNKLDAHRVIPGIYEGQLSIRESAHAAGHDELPIWITEVGKEANVANTSQLDAQRVYVQRVLDAMATRSWWGGTIFYEGSEEHPGGQYPNDHWGLALRTSDPDTTPLDDFTRKPAWEYLKQRLAQVVDPTDGGVAGADASGSHDGGDPGNGATGDAGTTMMSPPAGCGCGAARGGDAAPAALLLLVSVARRRRR